MTRPVPGRTHAADSGASPRLKRRYPCAAPCCIRRRTTHPLRHRASPHMGEGDDISLPPQRRAIEPCEIAEIEAGKAEACFFARFARQPRPRQILGMRAHSGGGGQSSRVGAPHPITQQRESEARPCAASISPAQRPHQVGPGGGRPARVAHGDSAQDPHAVHQDGVARARDEEALVAGKGQHRIRPPVPANAPAAMSAGRSRRSATRGATDISRQNAHAPSKTVAPSVPRRKRGASPRHAKSHHSVSE